MNLIVAVDQNWGIGKGNQLLYHVAPDMRYFLGKTSDGVVIMGRKTMESLPGALPLRNRINVVLTHTPERLVANTGIEGAGQTGSGFLFCEGIAGLAPLLKGLPIDTDRVWVIGGGAIYALLAPYCREAYVTKLYAADTGADRWMPNLDAADAWAMVEVSAVQDGGGIGFAFCRYVNRDVKMLP